jgi:hypothetical protein
MFSNQLLVYLAFEGDWPGAVIPPMRWHDPTEVFDRGSFDGLHLEVWILHR